MVGLVLPLRNRPLGVRQRGAPSPKHARAIADALDRCSPICSQSTEIVGETVPLPRL